MTLDSRARSAVADLRANPARVAPALTLGDLRRRDRARTRRGVAAATSTALVLVVLVAGVIVRGAAVRSIPPIGPAPAPSHSVCPSISAGDAGTCATTVRTRIDLKVPVTVTVGWGFTRMYGLPGASKVFFRSPSGGGWNPGVLVQEDAVPVWLDPAVTPKVGYAATTARDPSAGSTPTSVAHWLATRPYLQVTSLSRTTLSGLPAVRLDLKRNGGYSYPYGAFLPVFDGNEMWLDTGQDVRLWLIDLPDVGLTAVWSSTGNDHADLDKSLPLVESISFGTSATGSGG